MDDLECVSGRYRSAEEGEHGDKEDCQLELRLDVDSIAPHSKVLNAISGDFFRFDSDNPKSEEGPLFIATFLCNDSDWSVRHNDDKSLHIEGRACVYHHPDVVLELEVMLNKVTKAAEVSLAFQEGKIPHLPPVQKYNCFKVSRYFRSIKLDVDFQNPSYHLPVFRTLWHKGLYKKYGDREFGVLDAFKEAGLDISEDKQFSGSIVPDPNETDKWTTEELLSSLESERRRWTTEEVITTPRNEMNWKIWLLLADQFHRHNLKGFMFDILKKGRKGAAVFVNSHKSLPPWNRFGQPKTKHEVRALWDYLFTCVHEIGHALNFPHASEPTRCSPEGREGALSWMNYPEVYKSGDQKGYADFFVNFRFEFDRTETLFVRHGCYDDVKPSRSSFSGLHCIGESVKSEILKKSVPKFDAPPLIHVHPHPSHRLVSQLSH